MTLILLYGGGNDPPREICVNCVDERETKVRLHLLGASDLLGLAAWVVLRCVRVLWEWVWGRFTSRKPIKG